MAHSHSIAAGDRRRNTCKQISVHLGGRKIDDVCSVITATGGRFVRRNAFESLPRCRRRSVEKERVGNRGKCGESAGRKLVPALVVARRQRENMDEYGMSLWKFAAVGKIDRDKEGDSYRCLSIFARRFTSISLLLSNLVESRCRTTADRARYLREFSLPRRVFRSPVSKFSVSPSRSKGCAGHSRRDQR